MDVNKILEKLSEKRPVFHSEADFQHALAFEIQNICPKWNVRLEVPKSIFLQNSSENIAFDIVVFTKNRILIFELKYKTKKAQCEIPYNQIIKNEIFNLKNQSAQDQGRYDFLKDVSRIETLQEEIRKKLDIEGYVIMLTNDKNYWENNTNIETLDQQFRIYDGRVIEPRNYNWGERTSEGTKAGRKDSIIIKNTYQCKWNDYSEVKCTNKDNKINFRYLIFKI